jgi:hypothetical protein
MIKSLMKLGINRMCLIQIKATYDKPISNIILKGEKLKPLPLKSGMRQRCSFSLLPLNIILDIIDRAVRQYEEIK